MMQEALPEIQLAKDLLSNLREYIIQEAKEYNIVGKSEDPNERKKIDSFINSLHSSITKKCNDIYNNCQKRIDTLGCDSASFDLLMESTKTLTSINSSKYAADYAAYLQDAEFRYSAPIICTQVLLRQFVRNELINKLLNLLAINNTRVCNEMIIRGASAKEIKKISTTLTVEELAYLFKLFVDVKIFTPNNLTDIYRLISAAFTTSGSNVISENSIKNHYYDPSTKAINKTYFILTNLITQAKKAK